MESGNSSSMQSSSGGDDQDQYDESSGGVIGSGNYFFSNTTARINNSSTNNTNTNTNTNPLPTQYHHHHHDHQNNPDMFMGSSSSTHQIAPPPLDPPQHHGNFLEPFENHQPNFQNLMFWQTQQFSGGGLVDSPPVQNPSCTITPNNSNNQQKPSSSNTTGAGGSGSGSGKNPRKRTRASRRAPTTVLTTDTSNFRAMVQEFTGIPSSPFSAAASPLLSRRLTDLLAGPSSVGPSLRPGRPPSMMGVGPSSSTLERILAGYNNNSTNNYPFRPSAHKPNNTPQNTNSNISFQSLLQSNISPSPASTIGTHPSLVGGGSLLPHNVGNFPDLSGVIGGDQMFGFSPEGGGWRGGGSSGAAGGVGSSEERDGNNNVRGGTGGGMSQQHHPCSSTDDVAKNNTNTSNNNNINASNQQMESGSISGGGTCNYNVNCSGDKGLDSTPNLGGGQGTLGDLLG